MQDRVHQHIDDDNEYTTKNMVGSAVRNGAGKRLRKGLAYD